MSPTEFRVLRLAALGLPDKQIGPALGMAERTVTEHLERTYRRLGVHSRIDAFPGARLVAGAC